MKPPEFSNRHGKTWTKVWTRKLNERCGYRVTSNLTRHWLTGNHHSNEALLEELEIISRDSKNEQIFLWFWSTTKTKFLIFSRFQLFLTQTLLLIHVLLLVLFSYLVLVFFDFFIKLFVFWSRLKIEVVVIREFWDQKGH
jgi:hypothetical protein